MYKQLVLLGALSGTALAQAPQPQQTPATPAGAAAGSGSAAPTNPPTATPAPGTATTPESAPAAATEASPAPATPPAAVTPPAEPTAAPASQLPFKISGKVYVDASYLRNEGDGKNTVKSRGVDVKRFYLGIDYTLSKIISATFLTDIGDQNGKYDVFVKKGFVQAKFMPEFALRAGVGDTTWIPFVEDVYGYRYLEQTVIDRTKFGNSADWGLHALGRLANDVIGYQVSIVNGNGYGNASRAKWPSIEARVDAKLIDHLIVAGDVSISTLGAVTDSVHTGTRYDGLVAWTDKLIRAGVEGFYAKNYTKDLVTGKVPGASDAARGVSVFASYYFMPKVGALGRVDFVQPVADTDGDVKDTYFNVGVEYLPYKFLNLALIYKRDVVDTGAAATGFTLNTGNGAIGSPMPNASGTYQEVGVFGQLKF